MAVWSTVGTLVERAKYDSALSNWKGVAACISAGIPLSELSSLRIDFLRDSPDAEHRGRMLMRLCRAELTNDRPAEALMHLEAALTLDPLNWLMHETRRMVVDLQR
jgi:serine/threonine-protein kinase